MENSPSIDDLPMKNGDFPWFSIAHMAWTWLDTEESSKPTTVTNLCRSEIRVQMDSYINWAKILPIYHHYSSIPCA